MSDDSEEMKAQMAVAEIIMEEWEKVLATLTENSLDSEVIAAVEKEFKKPITQGEKE